MKKLIAILLLLIIVVSATLMVGCEKSKTTGGSKTTGPAANETGIGDVFGGAGEASPPPVPPAP